MQKRQRTDNAKTDGKRVIHVAMGAPLGESRAEVGVLEELGVVEDFHDEGDGGDVSHIGDFGDAGAPGQDATDAFEGVGDTRTGVPFGRERA